ncbi:Flp family type IVb pilin [Aeromicrobium stalagmiti]|uniref:Flp family type IVb pilin n=1 Tax=Aeromicrobium stalagmiti TaxID=2738988 RepID=UPI001C2C7A1C|nr:Flp family type IVb pilin [Aeromicrobium stalagmiti]
MSAFTKMFAVITAFAVTAESRKKEDGVTAIEYALMAAGIAVLVVAALAVLGPKINGLFSGISL